MNVALIFAGGSGTRMGIKTIPKQFLKINNKPIIIHTIEHFENHTEVDAIAVVCLSKWVGHLQDLIIQYNLKKILWVIEGGETALESQYKGLLEIYTTIKQNAKFNLNDVIVLIHDGVRPLINKEVISKSIECTKKYSGVVVVSNAIETIITIDSNNKIRKTIQRTDCKLARAPQTFYLNDIITVHEKAQKENKYSYVDSVSMMLDYGKEVYTLEGPPENIKVTTYSDFFSCQSFLENKVINNSP